MDGSSPPLPDAGYDSLPYSSLPISYSQPTQLAAMARLFGLASPPIDRARVLEIGCAGGGNIIPLAARFPEWTFSGFDLSQRHVDEASSRIATLGLSNCNVRQADLSSITFGTQTFDYIICHGVYSWVPPAAHEAILRLCRSHLSENGVAIISFNVLPGWHLRSAVLDIARAYGSGDTIQAKVASARTALNDIAAAAPDKSLYAALLKVEAERLAKMPPSHVFGEFMSSLNVPLHFSIFAERVRGAGLAYVCEADVAASLPDFMAPGAAALIKEQARGDRLAEQQRLDFISGRTFRRAMLVRQEHGARIATQLEPRHLDPLHFHAPIVKAEGGFRDGRGRELRVKEPVAEGMLRRFAESYPATCSVDELLGAESKNKVARANVLRTLLGMLGRRQATAFATPLAVGRADAARPVAWAVARREAQSGQPWLTSQHHRTVPCSPVLRFLLPLMDGTLDRDQLKTRFAEGLSSNLQMREAADVANFEAVLRFLSRNGLLAP